MPDSLHLLSCILINIIQGYYFNVSWKDTGKVIKHTLQSETHSVTSSPD